MSPLRALRETAFAFLLISIGGCDPEKAKPDLSTRTTLPHADTAAWRRCVNKPYPRWAPGDVPQQAVIAQEAKAEKLNTDKTVCGNQAISWIESVKREYGK